jgi:HSP20 family protein
MALPTRVMRTNLDYPFESLRDLDTLMRGIFQREGGAGTGLAPYGVDIREDADHIYVEAELPGFRKDEVDVTLENQTLTIAAERRSEHQLQREPRNSGGGGGREGNGGGAGDGGQWLLNERRYTRFLRSFTLPPTVDEGSVQAKPNDGVLTITINKREETKPRKVKVG